MARLILLLLLLIFEPARAGNQPASDELAPEFALKNLKGQTVRLADCKGKVLLINFWATWCAPCRAEMPDLAKLKRAHAKRGLEIIGITYPPTNRQSVRRVAKQLKINYPILFGTGAIADAYGAGEVLPTTIVVDREGKIRARILGILTPEEFEQSVKPLLAPMATINLKSQISDWRSRRPANLQAK